jgi:hypothetical protein
VRTVEITRDIPALPDRREWSLTVDGRPFQRYIEEGEALHAAAIIRGDIKATGVGYSETCTCPGCPSSATQEQADFLAYQTDWADVL